MSDALELGKVKLVQVVIPGRACPAAAERALVARTRRLAKAASAVAAIARHVAAETIPPGATETKVLALVQPAVVLAHLHRHLRGAEFGVLGQGIAARWHALAPDVLGLGRGRRGRHHRLRAVDVYVVDAAAEGAVVTAAGGIALAQRGDLGICAQGVAADTIGATGEAIHFGLELGAVSGAGRWAHLVGAGALGGGDVGGASLVCCDEGGTAGAFLVAPHVDLG